MKTNVTWFTKKKGTNCGIIFTTILIFLDTNNILFMYHYLIKNKGFNSKLSFFINKNYSSITKVLVMKLYVLLLFS
jgi:uncharacterized membrane-anchored protein